MLLLANRAAGLALVLLAPLALNALLYHVKFDPAGVGAAALFCLLVAATAALKPERFASLFR